MSLLPGSVSNSPIAQNLNGSSNVLKTTLQFAEASLSIEWLGGDREWSSDICGDPKTKVGVQRYRLL